MILGRIWEAQFAFPFSLYMLIPTKKAFVTLSWSLLHPKDSPPPNIIFSYFSFPPHPHFFQSLLLSKSIRSLTAFLGQSKPISASSFKHICHPMRCSEDVLAVHTQHVEQTGILTSSRADLSQPLIENPAPYCTQTPSERQQTCS